jgi:hypothetical protein
MLRHQAFIGMNPRLFGDNLLQTIRIFCGPLQLEGQQSFDNTSMAECALPT